MRKAMQPGRRLERKSQSRFVSRFGRERPLSASTLRKRVPKVSSARLDVWNETRAQFEQYQDFQELLSAIQIQRVWRGHQARCLIRGKREINRESNAATKIKSSFRDSGRTESRVSVESVRELSHPGVAGDRREGIHSVPTDTRCEQCGISNASVICRQCVEPFCDPCFALIHSGGRRRDHVATPIAVKNETVFVMGSFPADNVIGERKSAALDLQKRRLALDEQRFKLDKERLRFEKSASRMAMMKSESSLKSQKGNKNTLKLDSVKEIPSEDQSLSAILEAPPSYLYRLKAGNSIDFLLHHHIVPILLHLECPYRHSSQSSCHHLSLQ